MAKKICIDAGHYGKYNRSPAVKEYYESDMTWKLHKLLKKYLEEYGLKVIVTRETKTMDKPLYERGKTSKGCDLFLSLHSNAVGNRVDESVDRVVIYGPLSGKGHDIAKKLANCIVDVMQTKQGGYVQTRKGSTGKDYYGVIRGATAVGTPGLLIEHSFHTNTRSTKWLLDENNLDKLARAEAKVLATHYGMTGSKEPEKVEPDKPETGKDQALGYRVLKVTSPLMQGDDVEELQTRLNALKFDCGGVDGKYGKNTQNGVKALQKAASIEIDGIFGTASLKALEALEKPATSYTTYTVKAGDSLWKIAEDKLGDGNRYKEIMELNGLKSDVIQKGQKLKIPKK